MAESVDQFADIRRRHVLATFLFSLGSSMVSIVTAYIVYQQSGSVAVSGLIMVCSSLPAVLLPAPATAIARRWGGPKDYVYSRLAIGVVGFIPVVLSMTGRITTVNLLLWFLLSGILYALSGPATSLIRAMIAAPGQVPEFNGAVAKATAAGTVIGLIAGGAVFAVLGSTLVFAIGAVVSIAEGLLVVHLLALAPHTVGPRERFREALGVARTNPSVRAICVFTAWCFLIGGYSVTLPAVAALIGTSPLVLSVLQTAAVVGGILVGWAVRAAHTRIPWGAVHRLCYITVAVGVGVLAWVAANAAGAGLRPELLLVLATVAIIPVGFALTMDTTILGSLIQIASQSGSRNAVLSGYAMLPALFAPMGQELIGLASDRFSVGTALAAVAVVVGISVVVGAVSGGHLTLRRDLNALSEAEGPPAAAVSLPRSGGNSHEGSLPVGALAGP